MNSNNNKIRLNEDRISSLPDGVLCHILSFLPTKYSVRTRILSTRWNNLFTFVPILVFDYSSHDSNLDSPACSASSFIQFVNSVFILYNVSRLHKFHLHFNNYGQSVDRYPISSWISFAINRQVQDIDINLCFGGPWTLPRDLFSCKTLTSLRIWRKFNIVLPQSVCLPCLKTCNFGLVSFNNDAARRLFRSCPALEELSLTSCYFRKGVDVLNISSNTLKRFNIHVCEDHFKFVLNAPNLVYFDYVVEGPGANEFSGLESLKSLVDASICYEQESNIKDSVSVELVRGFSHIRQLCLYCGPMEAFLRSGHSLPTFKNLTRLILGRMSPLSSELLSDILDSSPRLEFISFNQMYGDELDGADQNNYVLPEHVPICVSLHIKEVEFRYFGMFDYECKLIKYFLKYANNLKKMHIRTKLSWHEQFEISSTSCQIVFDPDSVEDQ